MKAVKSLICTVVLVLLTGLVIWIGESDIWHTFGIEAELFFCVIFGVPAIVCAISTVIHTVLILIRKLTKFRPKSSKTAVFLASNLTLLAISGVIIFFDLLDAATSRGEDFINLSGITTILLMFSVVPVCVICTIICIVILVRRRKRQ